METYLLERGLEQERILKEESSTSTLENLQNAKAILETEAGLSPGQYRVVVVSTDFHIYRALKVAGRARAGRPGPCPAAPAGIWRQTFTCANMSPLRAIGCWVDFERATGISTENSPKNTEVSRFCA